MTHRIATAVLLTRPGNETGEVFLVLRSAKLRFFGGYWAFPGGVVDAIDVVGEADGEETHRRCALRELFEETGVLVAALAERVGAAARGALRRGLLGHSEDSLADWRELVDDTPQALTSVHPFARVTTPPFAPLRYRTRFVHVELPRGETPSVIPGELDEGRFFAPEEALASWTRGERLIVPPALFLLGILRESALEPALERASRACGVLASGGLHQVRNVPGIWMLPLRTPTIPPATTTNAYLVGEQELYLVDPATYEASERERLFAFVDERVSEGRRVAGVLVTHHHPDHVGSVEEAAERYRVPVHAHALTLERLPGRPRETRVIEDGSTIALGRAPDGSAGWHLTAFHTPGHDRGHLVFLDSRYRALIAGDLVSTLSTIVIDPPEGHLATYLASLRRMLAEPLGILHPAHGPVARDAHALLRSYLEHRSAREESLVAALAEGNATIEECLPRVYADVERALWPYAARSLAAGLEKLVEEGRASRSGGRWQLASGS
jgi:glyoxylase-like metal-dependent hydrolase (beta-lactamase superfamily II)/8-oxo-dGTP pyrophosphatase MutT (NUDIX family)